MRRDEGSNDPTVIVWPTASSFHNVNYSINNNWKEFQFTVDPAEHARPGVITFCPLGGSDINIDAVLSDAQDGQPLPAGYPMLSWRVSMNTVRLDFYVGEPPADNAYYMALPRVQPGLSYYARVRTSLGSPELTGQVNVQLLCYA